MRSNIFVNALMLPVLLFADISHAAAAGNDDASALQVLRAPRHFMTGPVGEGGITSKEEKAFREVLKEKNARDQFNLLLSSATTEGQMYALLGLKILKAPEFRRASQIYEANTGSVSVMEGCEVFSMPAKDIVVGIRKGKYK